MHCRSSDKRPHSPSRARWRDTRRSCTNIKSWRPLELDPSGPAERFPEKLMGRFATVLCLCNLASSVIERCTHSGVCVEGGGLWRYGREREAVAGAGSEPVEGAQTSSHCPLSRPHN